tara:strand:+ start:1071 stop:1244 length:174 start_codon:yes stop_codon:yes gene_type:complete
MLSALLLLAPPGSSAQAVVCATGFVMDTFCMAAMSNIFGPWITTCTAPLRVAGAARV